MLDCNARVLARACALRDPPAHASARTATPAAHAPAHQIHERHAWATSFAAALAAAAFTASVANW